MAVKYKEIVKRVLENYCGLDAKESNIDRDKKTITYSFNIENSTGTMSRKMSLTINEEENTIRFQMCLVPNVPEKYKHNIYKMINDMQSGWRYVRMYMDGCDDLIADYIMKIIPIGKNNDTFYENSMFEQNMRSVIGIVTSVSMRYADQALKVIDEDEKSIHSKLTVEQIDLNPFGKEM